MITLYMMRRSLRDVITEEKNEHEILWFKEFVDYAELDESLSEILSGTLGKRVFIQIVKKEEKENDS